MNFFHWLFGRVEQHTLLDLDRFRVDRAGRRLYCAAVTRERRTVCRTCGIEIIPWHRIAGPEDLGASGIELSAVDWSDLEMGPVYFGFVDQADSGPTQLPNSPHKG